MAHEAGAALLSRSMLIVQPQSPEDSIDVCEDNAGAIALEEIPLRCTSSKHIDVRYHFLRTLVQG